MFEKEIKFITDFSLEEIKSLGPYFSIQDISSTDIHPSITKYISAELSYLIYEDRQKLLSSSVFNYSDPKIIKLFKSVDNELKKIKPISYQDVKKLVLQSVSFNANFVLRPKWSLVKLIYNESDTKSAEEIILMMDYIYFHEYLRSIFTEYIEKKKLSSISKEKFEEIIFKIDTALIQKDVKSYIDNSFVTMLEFFSIGDKNKTKIGTDYVEIFLKEKNLIDPLMKLKKAFVNGTVADIEEIKEVIFSDKIIADIDKSKLAVEQEKDAEIETEEIEEEKEEKAVDENDFEKSGKDETENVEEETIKTVDETIDDTIIQGKDELLNAENDDELLTLFDKELKALAEDSELVSDLDFSNEEKNDTNTEENIIDEDEVKQNEKQVEEIGNENELEMPDEINDEVAFKNDLQIDNTGQIQTTDLNEENEGSNFIEGIPNGSFTTKEQELHNHEDKSKENKTVEPNKPKIETTTKPKREKDIFQYLSDKEIEKIVSNVFNEDREDFAITLEKVSECETFEEANEIIKGVYISYRVNMYTKDASTLTNAISKYFNQ